MFVAKTKFEDNRKEYNKTKAWLKYLMLGSEHYVEVEKIPSVWSKFLDTEDEWINVPFPESENTTCCLYNAVKGSLFPPHKHKYSEEQMTLIEGSVRVYTESYSKVYEAPCSFVFDIDEGHAIEFLEDTKSIITWHPKMHGWHANFEN